ncbi:MAG: hypothetical protein HYV51_03015 [Parcubacteria group bacterium]|nr:hypothetical protein [Parcubacteria group bacterium]
MINLIKNLQNKPEPIKRLIMWFGVFSVMAVIFMFWILTFPSQIPASENTKAAINVKKELPGVWQSLNEQVNNLKDMWAIRLR